MNSQCSSSGWVITPHQQQKRNTSLRELQGNRWGRSVPAARIQWCKLSVNELVLTGGELGKLATLIEQRYKLATEVAMSQAKRFLDACGHWS